MCYSVWKGVSLNILEGREEPCYQRPIPIACLTLPPLCPGPSDTPLMWGKRDSGTKITASQWVCSVHIAFSTVVDTGFVHLAFSTVSGSGVSVEYPWLLLLVVVWLGPRSCDAFSCACSSSSSSRNQVQLLSPIFRQTKQRKNLKSPRITQLVKRKAGIPTKVRLQSTWGFVGWFLYLRTAPVRV